MEERRERARTFFDVYWNSIHKLPERHESDNSTQLKLFE